MSDVPLVDISRPSLRICLDVNIWVSHLISSSQGHHGAVSAIVDMVTAMRGGTLPLQLFLSYELLSTLRTVLLRESFSMDATYNFTRSVEDLMLAGPERLDPHLFVSGRDQLAITDREDAGVLGACFAGRVDLPVTDNLKDFGTNDSERIDTQMVTYPNGARRRLYAILHERVDGASLVVMHAIDALSWLRKGQWPTPDVFRHHYRTTGIK